MSEGSSSAPSVPAPTEQPTAEQPTAAASLTISLRPYLGAKLEARVPARHTGTLVTTFGRVSLAALLGVVAPVATVLAAAAVSFPAAWTVVLVLIEIGGAVASAITTARVRRRR